MRRGRLGELAALALGLVACIGTAGCGRSAEQSQAPRETAPRQAGPAAEEPLVVRPGCPFEGCQYGQWVPLQVVPVHAAEGDTSQVAFTLEPGEPVTAVEGNIHVIPGLVVATDSVEVWNQGTSSAERIPPGDTVVVLDYVGEGTYNAEVRGRPYQVSQFWTTPGSGRVLRAVKSWWWVRVRAGSGREGWALIRPGDRFKGWDRLGGPGS